MILVTGGCRSGKSEYGEELAAAMGEEKLYIATGQIVDEEMVRRVENHQKRRGHLWITHEGYKDLEHIDYNGYSGILLDSVTSMVTNLLFDFIGEDTDDFISVDYDAAQEEIMDAFRRLMAAVHRQQLPLVMVTDEIGLGVVPETPLGREFRDILGRVNQYLAGEAAEVYLVVSGIPLKIKSVRE